MKVLVTGSAGFIGSHITKKLKEENITFVGIDSINDYYDTKLKYARLNHFKHDFRNIDICNQKSLYKLFINERFTHVIHLAAQPGVRNSVHNPQEYMDSNIVGFWNILDMCNKFNVSKFIFASSSSVYGDIKSNADGLEPQPTNLYAATKKANEVLAQANSAMNKNMKHIGFRIFNAYGPWGRPDMAYYLFLDKIIKDHPVTLFNSGNNYRDMTYIDNVAEIFCKSLVLFPDENYDVYNIGTGRLVKTEDLIHKITTKLKKSATIIYSDSLVEEPLINLADIRKTIVDFDLNENEIIQIDEGMNRFIEWYRSFYKL